MIKVKRFLAVFALVFLAALPALGWEFQMTGSMIWAYEFYNQNGNNGFFGKYNLDNGAGTTTANLNNWWNGPRLSQNIVTGQDASKSYFYVVFDPKIQINPAIKLQGRFRLGQFDVPQYSYYYTFDAIGTDNAFSEAQFTMFWATAATPWGTVAVGKRPWKFGTGFQYDGTDGLTTESILINAPYGPFDIGFGFYPHKPARRGQTIGLDPYDLVAPQYFNHADKSGVILNDAFAYVVYGSGPLQAGVLGSYGKIHIGPEAPLVGAVVPATAAASHLGQDSEYFHGTIFKKFNNGRFFANAEAAFLYWRDRFSGTGAPLFVPPAAKAIVPPLGITGADPPATVPNPRDTEQWRYMVEAGVLCGPTKLTFLASWQPGPDRRGGAYIGKQNAAFVWHPSYDTLLGNYDVFRPYSFILSYNYGGGLNAYNLSLDGYMRDAWVLAGRLDYAVAANLNAYGTFMWAERTSNGYGWACIAPNDALMPPQFIATANDGNIQFRFNGAAGSPNIPDTALGWEVNGGVDWAILEGWTTGFLVGYWQPGKWFSYACVDRSVPGWNVPSPANFFGTNPGRTIDPIIAGQFTMSYSF